MSTACAQSDFVSAYGRSMGSYLAGVAAQSGCHAQYVYVQNAVLCPVASCGNGIQEPTEQCDDGNQIDADGCRANCTRGECTICPP